MVFVAPTEDASGGELEGEEDDLNLSRVCMHKRWRVFCAECGGNGPCEHGKREGIASVLCARLSCYRATVLVLRVCLEW
jgi:hypothetical protein